MLGFRPEARRPSALWWTEEESKEKERGGREKRKALIVAVGKYANWDRQPQRRDRLHLAPDDARRPQRRPTFDPEADGAVPGDVVPRVRALPRPRGERRN